MVIRCFFLIRYKKSVCEFYLMFLPINNRQLHLDSLKHKLYKNKVLYLNIKVIPKAQRTEFVELLVGPEGEEILKVKVAAIPEKGKANKALCEYFANTLGTPKSHVSVVQGQTSQRKVIKVTT